MSKAPLEENDLNNDGSILYRILDILSLYLKSLSLTYDFCCNNKHLPEDYYLNIKFLKI